MKYIWILCIAGLLLGCANEQIHKEESQQKYYDLPSGDTVAYTVEEAPQWSALFKRNSGSFGAGIFVNTRWAGAPDPDGYVYIYGVRGEKKELIAARVKPEAIENFEEWRYWDGSKWNQARVDSSFFTYNAKAHPNISRPGELLVSYNVNSFEFFEKIQEYPHLYRPRFVRVTFGG